MIRTGICNGYVNISYSHVIGLRCTSAIIGGGKSKGEHPGSGISTAWNVIPGKGCIAGNETSASCSGPNPGRCSTGNNACKSDGGVIRAKGLVRASVHKYVWRNNNIFYRSIAHASVRRGGSHAVISCFGRRGGTNGRILQGGCKTVRPAP